MLTHCVHRPHMNQRSTHTGSREIIPFIFPLPWISFISQNIYLRTNAVVVLPKNSVRVVFLRIFCVDSVLCAFSLLLYA